MLNGQITMLTRDTETGEVVGNTAVLATSEDGIHWIFGAGYLPNAVNQSASDFKVDVFPPHQELQFGAKEVYENQDGSQTLKIIV